MGTQLVGTFVKFGAFGEEEGVLDRGEVFVTF